MTAVQQVRMTRREYLLRQAVIDGAPLAIALEKVADDVSAHPEWDTDERRTWVEWAARL